MILKKVMLNGKAVYEPISYEEALAYRDKHELVFTGDDEKEDFEAELEEREELTERIDELYDDIEEIMEELDGLEGSDKWLFGSRLEEIKKELEGYQALPADALESRLDAIEDELSEMEDKIDELIDEQGNDENEDDEPIKIKINGKNIHLGKDYGDILGKAFGNVFVKKKNSKNSNLIAALPFMDKEDLHELVNEILSGDERYKDINLVAIMQFMDTSDCDALFMKLVIEENTDNIPLATVAPFVSKKCLSELVDEYIKGNYQHVEMSILYPFLDGKDVKKIFNYFLMKNHNQE